MNEIRGRRAFLSALVAASCYFVGCGGSSSVPATRPLTPEELEQVKKEDKATEDEETTGGSGQKPVKKSR